MSEEAIETLKKEDSEKQGSTDDLAIPDPEPFRLSDVLFRRRKRKQWQPDAIATEVGAFLPHAPSLFPTSFR